MDFRQKMAIFSKFPVNFVWGEILRGFCDAGDGMANSGKFYEFFKMEREFARFPEFPEFRRNYELFKMEWDFIKFNI